MEVVELPNGLGSKLRAVEGLVVGEDWSGTGVERFGTTSTRFEHCRFERMRVGHFTAGGAGRFAEFVDCSFDRSHLSFSPAGRTRFVRCSFRRARLVDFRVNPVDLIDCDFTGADVRRSIFWGGLDDYKRRREPDLRVRNDIRGNDFSGATLVDTSCRRPGPGAGTGRGLGPGEPPGRPGPGRDLAERPRRRPGAPVRLPPQDEGSRRLARHQEDHHQRLAVRHR